MKNQKKKFKIRSSATGSIMGKIGLTDNQLKTLKTLKEKEKLTDNQKATFKDLDYRDKNPELPQTLKSYLENWNKEQIYGRRAEFFSKETDKGIVVESQSIDFIEEASDYGFLKKNEESFEDEYKTGTPDLLTGDIVIDVKNSWTCFTFPLYAKEIPSKDYWYQLQSYMGLTGKKSAKLIYTLMDTPKHIIDKEFKYNNRYELDYEEFEKQYLYSHIDPKYRIKSFDVERDNETIKAIDERVKLCRKYIETL